MTEMADSAPFSARNLMAWVAVMPFHHKDPFDRLLIAQAGIESLSLISADATIDANAIERIW